MALIAKGLTFSYAQNPAIKQRIRRNGQNDSASARQGAKSDVKSDSDGVFAVSDFSACFASGIVTAVIGPNGCGKTTLAKLLVGMLRPLCGSVTLDGEDLGELSLAARGKRIGFVSQQPRRQLFCTSVREEIDFGLKHLGIPDDEIRERSEKYLAYFGIRDHAERFPFELSTGEIQRLILAAVMAMKPSCLLLDEPTSALDRGRRAALGELLCRTAAEEQVGVVLISHDADFVANYAQEIIHMEQGRVLS